MKHDYNIFRKKAIDLRRKGYSYRLIRKHMPISKSTLSLWLREIPFIPNKRVLKDVETAKLKSAIFKSKQCADSIFKMKTQALSDIGHLSKRDLFMLGIALYIGEGSKSNGEVGIINSDSQVIRLGMRWLSEACNVPKEHFALKLHLYPDNNVEDSVKYWKKVTGISERQFSKVQIDRRINKSNSKRRKLPHGTVQLMVRSRGKKEFGVLLYRRIMGWSEAVLRD